MSNIVFIYQPSILLCLTKNIQMQSDQLLQEWKQAKDTCKKVIDISIQSNIYKTVTAKQSHQEFLAVYDVVYRLCSSPSAEESRVAMVYRDYKDILKTALLALSKQLMQEREVYRLQMLRKIFDAYEDILKRLRHMFAFLDRPYYIKQGKIEELDRTGISLIVNTLFTEQSLLEYDTIYFKQLAKIRKNRDLTDSQILKDYVEILYKFHVRLMKKQTKKARTIYTDFQQKYLSDAKQYYAFIFHRLQQLSPSQYFMEVNNLYDLQRRITEECFGTSSENLINKIFSLQFLEEYRHKLIQSPKGLKYILQNREVQAISIITSLYKKLTNSIDGFKEPFENFVFEQITTLLLQVRAELLLKKSQALYIAFIKKLIKKNNQLVEILEFSFMKFNQFIAYYKSGVERAFSKNQLQVPVEQMLATYVDVHFRVNYTSQDVMKEDVRNVKNIFECLQNKDMFLIKYLQKLAKRIMSLSPEGIVNHEHLIYYLKLHSGNSLAQKLESIVDQYKLSAEHEKQFRQVQTQYKLKFYINLMIFSESSWPSPDIVQFKPEQLPEIFANGLSCIKVYEKQYIQKKTLRISFHDSRVRWMYYFEAEVQNKFNESYFDTNGIQAILLYYIYQHSPQKVNIKVLQQIYPQIKPVLIRQSLTKMVDQPQNILLMTEEDDQVFYQFNKLMKSKKRIFQYDGLLEDQEQQQQLFQKNELSKQRQFAIDANLAKLMKTKKILKLETIVEQVIKMIKVFIPSQRDVKTSIERLLAKEILARDQKDRNVIKYKQ